MKKNLLISVEPEVLSKLLSIFPSETSEVKACELSIEYFLSNYELNHGSVEYLNSIEKNNKTNEKIEILVDSIDTEEDLLS